MESFKNKLRKEFSKAQKLRRTTTYNENRRINVSNTGMESTEPSPVPQTKHTSRLERLVKYKEQKKQKLEMEKKSKKPLFKVTRAPSFITGENPLPVVNSDHLKNIKSKINSNLKSRPTPTSLKIVPVNHQFKVPINIPKITITKTKTKPIPTTSIVTRSQVRKQSVKNLEGLHQSVAMKNATFFSSLPTSNVLSSTFLFESTTNSIPFPTPKDMSIITKSSPAKKSDEKDGAYFERLLDSEIVRLENRCKCWDSIIAENSSNIPTEVLDEIDSSVGQTRLLIKKKFEQFRGLTRGNCEKKITSDDLQGFWDMVYMQVTNLDERFAKLEDKKANNWKDKENKFELPVKSNKIDICVKKPSKAGPSVGLKEAIAAARRKKLEGNSDSGVEIIPPVNPKSGGNHCVKECNKVGPSASLKEAIAAARKKKLEEKIDRVVERSEQSVGLDEAIAAARETRFEEKSDRVVESVEQSVGLDEAIAAARRKKLELRNTEILISSTECGQAGSSQRIESTSTQEFKEVNNSLNKDTSATFVNTSRVLESNRLTRRQAFIKSKQERIYESQNLSCENTSQENSLTADRSCENTSQENSLTNKTTSYARKMRRGTIYNLLYGKSEKSVVIPVIITHESSTDIPTNEFNAGFFTILSPHKKPNTSTVEVNSTPRRPNIRKSLLSEKKRNASPGLFMMRASFGAKIAELNTSIEKCSINSENES